MIFHEKFARKMLWKKQTEIFLNCVLITTILNSIKKGFTLTQLLHKIFMSYYVSIIGLMTDLSYSKCVDFVK